MSKNSENKRTRTFYFSKQHIELIKKEAKITGKTQADIVRRAIDLYFDLPLESEKV